MTTNLGAPVNILLIEDNPGDVRLTREALKEGKVLNNLVNVSDGVEALAYLRRQGRYSDSTRPDLILLDLNLPTSAEQDILKAYDLHANCYITKPVGLEQFISVVKSIEEFWVAIVSLPPDGAGT